MINTFSGRWRFLSNFYPAKIEYRGIIYPSVENFYVAMKIKEDQVIDHKFISVQDCQEMISKIKDPSTVKKLGKVLKVKIMEWAVNEKFKDPELEKMLIDTGNEELVEGNWWNDTYWGVCNGVGENNLGKILMRVRDKIIDTNQKEEQ